MELDGPATAEGLRVCARQCSTCIFAPGNRMELRRGRVRDMVESALADNAAIVCHKTLYGARAVCRGYYDLHRADTLLCRLGDVFGVLAVEPDAYE